MYFGELISKGEHQSGFTRKRRIDAGDTQQRIILEDDERCKTNNKTDSYIADGLFTALGG